MRMRALHTVGWFDAYKPNKLVIRKSSELLSPVSILVLGA